VAPAISVLTRNRDFRNLFVAQLILFGGDWFALIPLMTLLQRLTGSGFPGALALAADTTVNALVLPYAGVIADRFDRRKVMIAANVAAIVAIGLLFGVRSAAYAWLGPTAIGLAAAAKGFYQPAASAALPNVVDAADLAAANALGGSAWGTMLVVGASLGGVVSAVFSPYTCFGVTIACLALAAMLAWQVRRPMQAGRAAAQPRPLRAIREALAYIGRNKPVLSLVTVKSAVGVGNGVLAIFPLLATVVFAVGPSGTGFLFAARGLGALVGPFLFRRILVRRSALMTGLALSMSIYGLAYLGVSMSPWFPLALAFVVVAHVAGGGNWVMSTYALQIEVPDELRGRVFATDMMIATLAIGASVLAAGALVDHVDPRLLVALSGGLTLLYGIGWRLATRRLLRGSLTGAASVAISPR
jgi:MFS family permease